MRTACSIHHRKAYDLNISQRGFITKEFQDYREVDVEICSFTFGIIVIRLDSRFVTKLSPHFQRGEE